LILFDSETNKNPPAGAVISTRKMATDPRADPQYGERVPYVIAYGEPNKQADRALEPEEFLADRCALLCLVYSV
jgi:DNA polymerase zeta